MSAPVTASAAAAATAATGRPGPAGPPSSATTVAAVAGRTGCKMLRTPQVVGIAVVQSIVFLLHVPLRARRRHRRHRASPTSTSSCPASWSPACSSPPASGAVGAAEDAESGLYDRLRSLPISDTAVLAGRVIAEALLLVVVAVITLGVGFIVGFRLSGPWSACPVALGAPRRLRLTVAARVRVARPRERQRPGRPGPEHPRRAVLVHLERVRARRDDARRC